MIHFVDLPFAKTPLRLAAVEFHEKPLRAKQTRLVGRSVLQPDLDLNKFNFKAVIDWIEIVVQLGKVTQFQYVQRKIEDELGQKCFIKAIGAGAGNTAHMFSIRLQEPKSVAFVLEVERLLDVSFGIAAPTTINAVEISVDAYPKVPSDRARGHLLGVMQRTIFSREDLYTNQIARPRLAWDNSSPKYIQPHRMHAYNERHYTAPKLDATMYLGAEADDVMLRLMDKIIDTQNKAIGTAVALEPEKQRVRIEVTLQGSGLKRIGVATLADMKAMSFTRLQGEFFTFRLFTTPPRNQMLSQTKSGARYEDKINREIFLKAGVAGLLFKDHVRKGWRETAKPLALLNLRNRGRRLKVLPEGVTVADQLIAYADLNERVTRALRDLENRERRALKSSGI
ncbi:hypothetical protein [Oceanisphaera sp.]|uniref:hypothetical protein n=1 Tax=Oceanisphaera sp. TaxID=1929979 RepID=UPI003A9202E7